VQSTTGEGAISLTQFWKNFNIRQAIENVANTMRAVWKYLRPYGANDICGFENHVNAVIEEISVTGKDSAFEDVDSHSQPLTDREQQLYLRREASNCI
jgi:hypothetical protein